jgi:predicted branched-subunit amino acid permease
MRKNVTVSLSPGFRDGVREAFGIPAAVLAAGYIGFGAMASDYGFPIWLAVISTIAIWALPGQLILVEMSGAGASSIAVLLAVAFSSVRFLPMTVSLMPILRTPRHGAMAEYLAAHFVAMTGWAAAMRRAPELPRDERLPYFLGFAFTTCASAALATAAGSLIAGALPAIAKIGFVFMNPVYFVLILLNDVRERMTALALAGGAVCGPLIYLASPQWSVLGGGLLGGSIAFAIYRMRGRHG